MLLSEGSVWSTCALLTAFQRGPPARGSRTPVSGRGAAHAAGAFGAAVPLRRAEGSVGVPLSVTPVFLSAEPREA